MDIKEALSDLIKDISQIESDALNKRNYGNLNTVAFQYHNGRYEVSHFVRIKLLELIKLLPTEQITYYVLKETDNLNDILKGVKDGRRTEKDTNERNYQEQN